MTTLQHKLVKVEGYDKKEKKRTSFANPKPKKLKVGGTKNKEPQSALVPMAESMTDSHEQLESFSSSSDAFNTEEEIELDTRIEKQKSF